MQGASAETVDYAKEAQSGTVSERKKQIELLVCKCKDCTHWEIGKDVLICKTCGLTLPAKITVDDHHMLHWQKHER